MRGQHNTARYFAPVLDWDNDVPRKRPRERAVAATPCGVFPIRDYLSHTFANVIKREPYPR